MAAKLIFEYDRIGDILSIGKCPRYRGQDTDEIGDGVVARLHPQTDVVENLDVLFTSAHILTHNPFCLDIPIAGGAVCGHPAAPEFDCLIQPGSQWLTLPAAAVAALELDVRPPRFPTYPGDKPADVSRCELAVAVEVATAAPA